MLAFLGFDFSGVFQVKYPMSEIAKQKVEHVERTKNQFPQVSVQSKIERMYNLLGKIDMMRRTKLQYDREKEDQIQKTVAKVCELHEEVMLEFKEQDEQSNEFISGDKL